MRMNRKTQAGGKLNRLVTNPTPEAQFSTAPMPCPKRASLPPGDWADTARAAHTNAVTQANWSIGLFATGGVAAISAVVLFAW